VVVLMAAIDAVPEAVIDQFQLPSIEVVEK
jgi:hypothetical protein